MNEFTIDYRGDTIHWKSPDIPMLSSSIKWFQMANLSPAFDYLQEVLGEPKKFVDVGACLGIVSFFMHEWFPDMEIHAYEPARENYECLAYNMQDIDNCHTHNVGLSDHEGTMTMAMPTVEQKSYMNYWKGDNVGIMSVYGTSEHRKQEIKVKRLDDLHESVDAIKIDAEGHDYQILLGAERLLLESRPFLMLELTPSNFKLSGNTLEEFLGFLARMRYMPTGGDHGITFFQPLEDLPETYHKKRFKFVEVAETSGGGYRIYSTRTENEGRYGFKR